MSFGTDTPDYRAGLQNALAHLRRVTDFRVDVEHIGDRTFIEWCEDLAAKGMKVDGKPFRLDDREALRPIYEAIPSTPEEAAGRTLVVMKATQLGLTVWEVLANVYMAIRWEPVSIGMFLPDQATASFKSEHRFMRVVRSVPDIYRRLIVRIDEAGKSRRIGEGNVLTRTIGQSLLMFLWTSGKVTTESRPADIVTLDEVQEMQLDHIDKVLARLGDSLIAFRMLLSTANMPELDIHYWYKQGTQEVWHTRCPHCHRLSDLSDPGENFPAKSIAFNNGQIAGAPVGDYVWTCPECGQWIEDPQIGQYVITNPGASPKIRSFLLPRTISPRMTPRQMHDDWARAKTGDQKKSFFNRTLARPYIDPEQLPVTMAHCLAAVEAGRRAGVRWQTSAEGGEVFGGCDQMGSFNCVILVKRMPDGRQAVIHVEAIYDLDPFARTAEIIQQYNVQIMVLETLPNVNDARKLANKFPGRVFLAGYADLRDDFMTWGDDLTKADRKTAVDERTRYTVTLNQYKCMQTALFRVRDQLCLFPDPDDLIQEVLDGKEVKRIPILRDMVFVHLTKTALVVEQKEDERKPRARVLKIGLDPHFSYALMLTGVAWARSYGMTTFVLPQKPGADAPAGLSAEAAQRNMPGLPVSVANMIQVLPPGEVCGRCTVCPPGNPAQFECTERGFIVQARDPGCPLFVERES